MHKRKHRKSGREQPALSTTPRVQHTEPVLDPCLYIQAHEADVIRGPSAASARLLECQDPSIIAAASSNSNSGLIQWGLSERSGRQSSLPVLWVDRYDVRLLLDHLPDCKSTSTQAGPPSPSGWSDLPSDSEDTFFFTPGELEDYHREKRRRLIERSREERLRALATADDQEKTDLDPWGGSDEEPDEAQRELIRRAASHVILSPNPAQLEMRILANYGTDKRFAFLRGRWSRVWKIEKERAKQHHAEEAKRNQLPLTSLGGLASYGDSDTDGEESADKSIEEPGDIVDTSCTRDARTSEDAVQEARRARAKAWSAQRRAEQSEPRPEEA